MMTESSIDSLERQIREQEERIEYLMERIRSLEKGSRRIEKKSGSSSSKTRIKLGHPQPNPFREKTRISFQLSETTSSVSLSIVDEGGEQIVQLLSEQKSSGYHELQWKGGDHEPGTYFCVLRANGDKRVKKLIKRK